MLGEINGTQFFLIETATERLFRQAEGYFSATMTFVIFVFSSIPLLVISLTKRLHSIQGAIMFSLSLSDLLMSVTVLTPSSVLIFTKADIQGTLLCDVQAVCLAIYQTTTNNLLTLCAIDRFAALTMPFTYMKISSDLNIYQYTLAFIIFIVFAATVPLLMVFGAFGSEAWFYSVFYLCFVTSTNNVFNNINHFLNAILPGFIIVFCYTSILIVLLHNRVKSSDNENSKTVNGIRRNQKNSKKTQSAFSRALKLFLAITLLYFIAYVPYMLVDVMGAPTWSAKLTTWMIFVNTLFNFPLFYQLNLHFKTGVHRIIFRRNMTNQIPVYTAVRSSKHLINVQDEPPSKIQNTENRKLTKSSNSIL